MQRYLKFVLSVGFVSVLSSCAYMQEGSYQEITFMTPEAHSARCEVVTNKIHYQVWPPQTISIKKSDQPMYVTCNAPGNRTVELKVYPEMSKRSLWGTPVGTAWDKASSSLYYYPDVIAVDFTNQVVTPNRPPAHNNPDIRQPESYDLEEFSTQRMRLNSDKNRKELPLLKRGEEYDAEILSPETAVTETVESAEPIIDVPAESTVQEVEEVVAPVESAPEAVPTTIDSVIEGLSEGSSDASSNSPAAPVMLYPEQ